MNNLRDRLKKISSEKKDAPKPEPPKSKPCESMTGEREAPDLSALLPEILTLMGGEGFSDLCLDPEDFVFIDTETTGLSGGVGTIAFEIGIGEIIGEKFVVTQLWMRDYDEEEDMLAQFASKMRGRKAIVSFNGKSFDLPLLIARCRMNRIPVFFEDLPHMDLLYPARRLYKLRLKQCNLTHMEETVLGLHRKNDIPGSEIPALWYQFLKDRDDSKLKQVFSHNFEDVYTMGKLFRVLYDAHSSPTQQTHQEDLFSMARIYDKAGDSVQAERCYVSVNRGSLKVEAGRALTRIYRKSGRIEDMETLLSDMVSKETGGIFPYVELAKLYEHRLHDNRKALYYTDEAIKRTMQYLELQELTVRRKRLFDKINRKENP